MTETVNIVLTGFMGTGKTTVGRLLAQQLDHEFVDTDMVIEQQHGPIADIFREHGETRFREIERQVAADLADRSGLVIATGGRMMLDPANVSALSANGRVFCLVATPDEILDRITTDPSGIDRPLLNVAEPRQRIIELLAERTPLYRRFAQVTTHRRSAEAIAADLANLATTSPRRLTVAVPGGAYDVVVGVALLPLVRRLSAVDGPVVVVTEPLIAESHLASLGNPDVVIVVPDAPHAAAPTYTDQVELVLDRLSKLGVDRSSTIVSLGSGAVGQVATAVAGRYLGGVDLVLCPTDIAAMVDTSIVATTERLAPNDNGPIPSLSPVRRRTVVADVAVLQTLDSRHFNAGMATLVSHGLLADAGLLDAIEQADWLADHDAPSGHLAELNALVARAAEVKIFVVTGTEVGGSLPNRDREPALSLSHAFAPALEVSAGLLHGEALGLGLIATARLSDRLGYCSADLALRVERIVAGLRLPTSLPRRSDPTSLLSHIAGSTGHIAGSIESDGSRSGRRPPVVLLRAPGKIEIVDSVPEWALREVIESLQP